MNSGIIPNLMRSSVRAIARSSSLSSLAVAILAPKPRPRCPTRRRTMSSSPLNAPVQTNRMSVVSILDQLLLRAVARAVGRDRRGLAFEDLEQRLLHAFAGDVARSARARRPCARSCRSRRCRRCRGWLSRRRCRRCGTVSSRPWQRRRQRRQHLIDEIGAQGRVTTINHRTARPQRDTTDLLGAGIQRRQPGIGPGEPEL